jgi:hypothetical protein
MTELRQYSDTIGIDLTKVKQANDEERMKNIFSGNKRFFDARIVKYKETLQRIPERSYDKPGEEITISESTVVHYPALYYLDRDGYLLDKNSYYLMDSSNSQVQLDPKHINLLKFYNLLQ